MPIRSLLPPARADRARLLQYFYRVETAVRAHPEANVQKFTLQNARVQFLQTTEWRLIEDYLLSSYRQNPTVLPVVLEMLVLRHLNKRDVNVERVGSFVNARLSTLTQLHRHGEICWLLFLCIVLRAPIRAIAVSELFGVEDSTLAILISDAKRLGLIQGTVDQSSWDRSLTADGLRSSMWLYAYESALKHLNSAGSKGTVTSDPYFTPLLSLNIEFYRSGSFRASQNTLLRQLRQERLRQLFQKAAVEDDLANDFDDFEDGGEEDSRDDVSDFY